MPNLPTLDRPVPPPQANSLRIRLLVICLLPMGIYSLAMAFAIKSGSLAGATLYGSWPFAFLAGFAAALPPATNLIKGLLVSSVLVATIAIWAVI